MYQSLTQHNVRKKNKFTLPQSNHVPRKCCRCYHHGFTVTRAGVHNGDVTDNCPHETELCQVSDFSFPENEFSGGKLRKILSPQRAHESFGEHLQKRKRVSRSLSLAEMFRHKYLHGSENSRRKCCGCLWCNGICPKRAARKRGARRKTWKSTPEAPPRLVRCTSGLTCCCRWGTDTALLAGPEDGGKVFISTTTPHNSVCRVWPGQDRERRSNFLWLSCRRVPTSARVMSGRDWPVCVSRRRGHGPPKNGKKLDCECFFFVLFHLATP